MTPDFAAAGHVIRRAAIDDVAQIAALFQLVYESSSHPCKTEAFVADTLRDGRRNVWHVSERDGVITGCMGMLRHGWNRGWEIVRGLTHPDHRGGGLATHLAQRAFDQARASGDCELIISFPRNRVMSRILSDAVIPGLRVVGHDGGINIAGGTREYHLVAISFPTPGDLERFTPARGSFAHCAFVQDAVLTPLRLSPVTGVYPPVFIAGDHSGHPDYGPFTFEYHPFCPSDSIEITAYTGPKTDPKAVAQDLVRTLESFAFVRHVRLAVLADKVAFAQSLRREGFAVTAYLPAWYLQSGMRYDCVLMVRRSTDQEPVDHGTRDLIDYFNQGFAECLSSHV